MIKSHKSTFHLYKVHINNRTNLSSAPPSSINQSSPPVTSPTTSHATRVHQVKGLQSLVFFLFSY